MGPARWRIRGEIVIFRPRPRHASASGGSLQAPRSKLLAPSSSLQAPRSKLLAPSSSLQAPRSKLPRSKLLASNLPAAVIRFDMHVDVSHSRHFDQQAVFHGMANSVTFVDRQMPVNLNVDLNKVFQPAFFERVVFLPLPRLPLVWRRRESVPPSHHQLAGPSVLAPCGQRFAGP